MYRTAAFALYFAAIAFLASTGVSQAAKGPDARDVALGTFAAVLITMAVLGLFYLLRLALGGNQPLPPEEPGSGAHH
jgi:hypothetical protein